MIHPLPPTKKSDDPTSHGLVKRFLSEKSGGQKILSGGLWVRTLTCLMVSVMADPWSQPRLHRIMVPKVDQMENPPPAHTIARHILSGVHLPKNNVM